ncbi:LANO_0H22210g1_1 [Lachancea nothofagi CBS 11611]|uniref:LANO_0H22210g1_1 n=1 Tax=Lachancea nothofagi CBS 11611 TaxID=1266666 RepID=A0A1G4KNH3_9SACH|nr:LANO_0H22210g1_1 [Lachancea nothofagi CBS 11611]
MVEWCAIVFDKKGSDRSTCRPQHLEGVTESFGKGVLKCAGALYHEVGSDGKPTNFAGSHLQIEAKTKEEALELIYSDVFAKQDIWDLENIIIYPFGCAVRAPK